MVHVLTEELVARGHEVTLFAAGTSSTSARLEACSPAPLWSLRLAEPLAYRMLQAERLVELSPDFDVIHCHDVLPWLLGDRMRAPMLTTMHGRLDTEEARALLAAHREQNLVSISDAQRRPVEDLGLRWTATVYHGLELDELYRHGDGSGGYLLFLGRTASEKGPASAIRIATQAGMKLKIASRLSREEQDFFERTVEPLLEHPDVEWIGEQNDEQKAELLRNARALLLPIEWDEPFGLVFIEALACGTPVLSRPLGSLPEIVKDGVHGFLRSTDEELAEACAELDRIDRRACRERALARFSVRAMTDAYENAYRRVMGAAAAA